MRNRPSGAIWAAFCYLIPHEGVGSVEEDNSASLEGSGAMAPDRNASTPPADQISSAKGKPRIFLCHAKEDKPLPTAELPISTRILMKTTVPPTAPFTSARTPTKTPVPPTDSWTSTRAASKTRAQPTAALSPIRTLTKTRVTLTDTPTSTQTPTRTPVPPTNTSPPSADAPYVSKCDNVSRFWYNTSRKPKATRL